MRIATMFALAFWLGVTVIVTGCGGMELGGKLGVYRVDSRSERQATYDKNNVPLKCWLGFCDTQKATEEVQGS